MREKEWDIKFMKEVFKLAKKGEGLTSPNPLVGAVIVKNKRIIAKGFHRCPGSAHAEIEAIKKAKESLEGSTLYVNLEPCYHWGRTPPCVDRIIDVGIKRVVISNIDPNPQVKGRSLRKLKAVGIKVDIGIMQEEGRRLNEIFFKNMLEDKPFVVVKWAQTLDGKIATKAGKSKWLTSSKAREYAKKLRDKYDAVLVGVNTVIKDNPTLNGFKKIPYKIILDAQLRFPLQSSLLRSNPEKLIIFTLPTKDSSKLNYLKAKGIKIFTMRSSKGLLDLKRVLDYIYRLGITSVFVEGGAFTIGSFFDQQCVEKIYVFISPKIMGGKDNLSAIGGEGIKDLKKIIKVKELSTKSVGEDILISGYLKITDEGFISGYS